MTDDFASLDLTVEPPDWKELEVENTNFKNAAAWPPSLKSEIFYYWYNANKPTARNLAKILPETITVRRSGETISRNTVSVNWLDELIKGDFAVLAERLDTEIQEKLEAAVIEKKIKMFEKHAEIAVEMQETALDYLREHKEDLNAGVAVRLLVEGVRIERESRGVPDALRKMQTLSDEQLMDEVKKLIVGSPVSPADDNF